MAPAIFGFVPLKAPSTDKRWLALKDEKIALKFSGPKIAAKTDRWVNYYIQYKKDLNDEWSGPISTYTRKYGDCEDIALLKRAILIRSGIPENHIFFVLVRDLLSRQDHALIVVYDEEWLVLDNFNSLTLPVNKVKDYMPIMAFSGDKAWLYGRKR